MKVPGPGKLETSATHATAAKVTAKKAGNFKVKVKLTPTGLRALKHAKSRLLTLTARMRFTPAGGQPKSKTVTLTFKRKAQR